MPIVHMLGGMLLQRFLEKMVFSIAFHGIFCDLLSTAHWLRLCSMHGFIFFLLQISRFSMSRGNPGQNVKISIKYENVIISIKTQVYNIYEDFKVPYVHIKSMCFWCVLWPFPVKKKRKKRNKHF